VLRCRCLFQVARLGVDAQLCGQADSGERLSCFLMFHRAAAAYHGVRPGVGCFLLGRFRWSRSPAPPATLGAEASRLSSARIESCRQRRWLRGTPGSQCVGARNGRGPRCARRPSGSEAPGVQCLGALGRLSRCGRGVLRFVVVSSLSGPVSVYAPHMASIGTSIATAVRFSPLRAGVGSSNYVVKRTCGERLSMNRALSAAGRLPRR
jgi:hypothetical protein